MAVPGGEFKKGLEGVVAAETKVCFIDGVRGKLIYCGYDIADLAESSTFEETTYLLWHGRLPKKSELDDFTAQLREEYAIPDELITVMRLFPAKSHPMDVLRTCVSMLGNMDPLSADTSREAKFKKAVKLTAKIPTIIATYDRLRKGRSLLEPNPKLPIAANFLYMMNGAPADPFSAKAMDVMLILHADHELNASTFAARVTISTESDMYSAITSAIGTLKGPLHGGANTWVMEFLFEIGDIDRVEGAIKERLARKQKIPGFGHRVYKTEDPRATILRRYSERLGKQYGIPQWYEMTRRLDEVVRREKNLYPNVDLYSASCYHCLGIPTDLYTCMFAMGRIAGWCAHVLEQSADNRIMRPLGHYTGPMDLKYVPIELR